MQPVEDGPGPAATSGERELRKEIRELKGVAERRLWKWIFQWYLAKVEARRQSSSGSGEKASTTESGS
jgi:hypothetical protein